MFYRLRGSRHKTSDMPHVNPEVQMITTLSLRFDSQEKILAMVVYIT